MEKRYGNLHLAFFVAGESCSMKENLTAIPFMLSTELTLHANPNFTVCQTSRALQALKLSAPLHFCFLKELVAKKPIRGGVTMEDKQFGQIIMRLIRGGHMSRTETYEAFCSILNDEVTEMQQGAFLAALCAKGETEQEIAGAWQAIYDLDTEKARVRTVRPLVDNCGTGMDTFKTFNISTGASLIASAGGIPMARHGARALTSTCGTVDIAEALGVDVECDVAVVAKSIEKARIGLFNGMSPKTHPNALGRILSKIFFGSTLNIAASLANPALPKFAVRGVYSRDMLVPVSKVMRELGYLRALIVNGEIDGSEDLSIDEASVIGPTYCAELGEDGQITEFEIHPSALGISNADPQELAPHGTKEQEAKAMVDLLRGKGSQTRLYAVALNASLVFYVSGESPSIGDGFEKAREILDSGLGYEQLRRWVMTQNRDPESGLRRLEQVSG